MNIRNIAIKPSRNDILSRKVLEEIALAQYPVHVQHHVQFGYLLILVKIPAKSGGIIMLSAYHSYKYYLNDGSPYPYEKLPRYQSCFVSFYAHWTVVL